MDYKQASSFWTTQDQQHPSMPHDELHQEVYTFLKSHSTCALATASHEGIRCTPLTYMMHGEYIDIFSEGGEKFTHLEANPHVALTIYDPYKGPGTAKSLQVEGKAFVYGPDDEDYHQILGELHMTNMLKRGTLYLIRIQPEEMLYLNGSLKERGYFVRQHLNLASHTEK